VKMKKLTTWIIGLLVIALPFLVLTPAAHAATNLIANPSVETPGTPTTTPQGWSQGSWGSNTAAFSYASTGEDGSRSLSVSLSNYVSGDAKWYFTPVAVTAGSTYSFSDYYQSTASSQLVAWYQNASGVDSYVTLAQEPASTTWAPVNINVTIPAGETTMTMFDLISSNGTLSTDNFSLTAATVVVGSTVAVTAPTANASIVGTTTLTATATDSTGIKNVQFQVDGANVGTADTTSPYSASWNSTTVTNGAHTVTAIATNTAGTITTSTPVTVTVNNPAAPGTNLIANPGAETNVSNVPTGWTSGGWGTNTTAFTYGTTGHSGTHSLKAQTTAYTSGDAKWYFTPVNITPGTTYSFSDYYQSTIATQVVAAVTMSDGSTQYLTLGSPVLSATWKQFTATFTAPVGATNVTVYHLISGVGTLSTDDYVLSASTVPSITINPVAATITGTVQLSATASDNTGLKSVQFQLDGANIGSAVTTAPYQISWDSTTATNGTHSLTAIATNTAGKTTTSAPVSINVSNATAAGGNLIPNSSMETVNPTNSKAPQDWISSVWGTNTTTFSYITNSGHTGTHSVKVQMTKYTDGDAKWYFTPQVIKPDTQYQFSDYYEATTATEIDAAFTMSDGSTVYQIIGLPDPATTWTKFTTDLSIPQGAVNVTIFHLIHSTGTLTIDDASLASYKPVGFNRPLVSITMDDGYDNMFTQALPLLQQYGFDSTQFIITDDVNQPGYLTQAQVQTLSTDGQEIASHTVTHDDMLTETAAQQKTELQQSQATLAAWVGLPITDLAFPNGLYNASIVAQTKTYYTGSRGVEDGLNSKDNFNPYDIKVQNVYNTTTTGEVADWVAQAQATSTWLVLVYHSVDPNLTNPVDSGIYNVTPTQFAAQLAAIKSSGVTVLTMQKALAEVTPQL